MPDITYKLLKIDSSNNMIQVDELGPSLTRAYIGGSGIDSIQLSQEFDNPAGLHDLGNTSFPAPVHLLEPGFLLRLDTITEDQLERGLGILEKGLETINR